MSLWTPLLWLAIIAPLLIIAQITTKKTNPKYLLLFVVYFLVDCYARFLGFEYIRPEYFGLNLNWAGMSLSLIIALVFIAFQAKEIRRDIGFTTQFHSNTIGLGILIFLGFLTFDFIVKLMIFPSGGEFNLEQLLFQATMPGLSEEIPFRGIMLWILSKALVPSKEIKGLYFGWGFVIITFLFGMIHGVVITENLELKIDWITIIYLTVISSLSVSILRKFTGNLIAPVLGHGMIDVMNFFIRLR